MRYKPGAYIPEETKFGYVIYDGSAKDFADWKFRTELKVSCIKSDNQEDYARVAKYIVETLRGDPLQCAVDLGITNLTSQAQDGITLLMDRILDLFFPLKDEESKALYQAGHKIGGETERRVHDKLYYQTRTLV